MRIEFDPKAVAKAAYLTAGLNLLAALAMATVLRPGLPVPGSLPEFRYDFIVTHRELWTAGWLLWHGAAISLLAFYVSLANL